MIEQGFFNRMKKMIPIRMLGTGMDLGDLNDHAYEICFLLIQNIFKRELNENSNRTRNDMLSITESIIGKMGLKSNRETIERIVDGTLWYKDPSKQNSFQAHIFNEASLRKESYSFRYFTIDRDYSNWDQGGFTVFMLTEEAQEMIFITREILEEFGFDLEQFYTLQLIKTGNLSKANTSIDGLIARVRSLINRERDYRRHIIREPQNMYFDRSIKGRKSKSEIQDQFREEQVLFQKMFAWKSRYGSLPEDKKLEAEEMFEKLERARSLHDNLAKEVMENLALEMDIRVNHPESFWNISKFSFKKDIWQNEIIKNGLERLGDLEIILEPLFSPKIDFIYPLPWAWAEQKTISRRRIKDIKIEYLDEEYIFIEDDWDLVVDLWSEVFNGLLEKKSYRILELNKKSEDHKEKWLRQRINIDIFMMFAIAPIRLTKETSADDERLKLFDLLCEKDPKFSDLEGKKIVTYIEDTKENFTWRELFISPYILKVEE